MNRVFLLGRIGKDPEMKYTQSGKAVCNLNVATTYRDQTEWTRVTCWGPLAENCNKYLVKGQRVAVEGRLETRASGDGQEKRYYTSVVANSVEFLDRPEKKDPELPLDTTIQPPDNRVPPVPNIDPQKGFEGDDFDDLPF